MHILFILDLQFGVGGSSYARNDDDWKERLLSRRASTNTTYTSDEYRAERPKSFKPRSGMAREFPWKNDFRGEKISTRQYTVVTTKTCRQDDFVFHRTIIWNRPVVFFNR